MSYQATNCTDHCSACGAHFTSIEAFDAHRSGSHTTGKRHCRHVSKVKNLETHVAKCTITGEQSVQVASLV